MTRWPSGRVGYYYYGDGALYVTINYTLLYCFVPYTYSIPPSRARRTASVVNTRYRFSRSHPHCCLYLSFALSHSLSLYLFDTLSIYKWTSIIVGTQNSKTGLRRNFALARDCAGKPKLESRSFPTSCKSNGNIPIKKKKKYAFSERHLKI